MMRRSGAAAFRPKPFLKWAGGKRQILDELLSRLPPDFRAYHEPMLGGGALFFELAAQGRICKAVLSDWNEDLICAYAAVQERTPELIVSLKKRVYDPDEYYRVRALDPGRLDPVERASLRRAPFESVLDAAKARDFVYLDPPYYPVSKTANFSAYEKSGFGAAEHRRLRDVFAALTRKGCYAMLSNSHSDFTLKLFGGFRIATVQAARAVNSKSSGRGPVREIIVRNY